MHLTIKNNGGVSLEKKTPSNTNKAERKKSLKHCMSKLELTSWILIAVTVAALAGTIFAVLFRHKIDTYIETEEKTIAHNNELAIQRYLDNNSTTVKDDGNGNKIITGYIDGEGYSYVEDNKTFIEGVYLDGVSIAGCTFDDVVNVYYDTLNKTRDRVLYTVKANNSTFIIDPTSIRLTTDVEQVLIEAFKVGRESDTDLKANYDRRLQIADEHIYFTTTTTIDLDYLAEYIEHVASRLDTMPTEPYITLRNLVGGGKPGVGTGGSSVDVNSSEIIYYTPKSGGERVPIAQVIFHNGASGLQVDREALISSILEAYNSEVYEATIELEFNVVEPGISIDELKASFAKVSEFHTSFETSNENRSRNIQKAAGLLHCIEFTPGVELTYNSILGIRTEMDGWLLAPSITGGREYVNTPGGGICQVSSTLYDALLLAGTNITITARTKHSIPCSYIDMGFDATVSSNGPDLAWVNSSDSPYFLLSYADMRTKNIYCWIYGTPDPDGCTYGLYGELVEEAEPAPPIMIAEPLWPTGYEKVTITPHNRYVVVAYRQKYDAHGNPIGEPERLHTDRYESIQGEIHYGTGDPSLPVPR